MLSKSFKAGKCKTSLKLAMARIKLLKNKREVQLKQMRRELAQLLETGQEQTARIRVEHVIREEKTKSAYELIEIYCELIVARLPIIESQKNCPIDLKEAISSLVYASPRCADIPELLDVRKRLGAKYGKEFITSALEVRPDCGVNRMMVEKLSARAPDAETKIKALTSIAQEHNIKWESKAFEEQLLKPNADLLNGPNTFASASKISMESSDAKLSSNRNQKNEPTMKLFQNDVTSKPTSANNFSPTNISPPSTSVSSTSQHESRAPDSSRSVREAKSAYSREENASLGQPNWNMEFKDATAAAQAAAESAERASMAARAAAELAKYGKYSRQTSTESPESSKYGIKDDEPDRSKGSNLEGAHIIQESVTEKRSHGMKPEAQNLQRDEVMQVSPRRETESIYGGYASPRRSLSRSPSHSSGTFVNDVSEINLHKADTEAYGHAQRNLFDAEPVEHDFKYQKYENLESDRWNRNENYSKSSSSHLTRSAFDDDTKWNSDVQKHENNDGEDSTMDPGKGIFGSDQRQPISSDYSAVVFDDYGSDTDDISIFGRHREGHSDSFMQNKGERPSSFPSDVDPLNPRQYRSGSLVNDGSSQLHYFSTEPDNTEHPETIKKGIHPPADNLPATFDDSDEFSSESEGVMSNSTHKEARKPDSLLHNQRSPTRGSLSKGSDHRLINSSFSGMKEEEEEGNTVWENKHEPEPKSSDKISRSGSSGLHSTQPSSRSDKTPRNLINSERDSYYFPQDVEPRPWESSKASATEEAETKDKFGMPSSPSDAKGTEISNELSPEGGQGLNLGRLTGGFKNKGYQRPPYVKSPLVGASLQSEQTSDGAPFNFEKPMVSRQDKSSPNFEIPDQERYDNSRISKASMEPDSDKAERLVSRQTFGRRGYRGEDSLSSDKAAEVDPRITGRPIASHQDNILDDLDVPAQESNSQRSRRRDYNESKSSKSPVSDFDPDSIEQPRRTAGSRRSRDNTFVPPKQSADVSYNMEKSTETLASSEVPKVELYGQRPRTKAASKELSSRMPITYFESDDDEPEELPRGRSVENVANKDVKLSRRTRDLPSMGKKDGHSRFTGRSDVPVNSEKENKPSQASSHASETLSDTKTYDVNLEGKKSSKSLQPTSSTGQPSVAPTKPESSAYSSKSSKDDSIDSAVPATESSSSKGSTSRESSLKNASHVHPKLPNYETFAAHFQSLRSNIR